MISRVNDRQSAAKGSSSDGRQNPRRRDLVKRKRSGQEERGK